jgi:hypothetical protein
MVAEGYDLLIGLSEIAPREKQRFSRIKVQRGIYPLHVNL